jgi:hypothetical protein
LQRTKPIYLSSVMLSLSLTFSVCTMRYCINLLRHIVEHYVWFGSQSFTQWINNSNLEGGLRQGPLASSWAEGAAWRKINALLTGWWWGYGSRQCWWAKAASVTGAAGLRWWRHERRAAAPDSSTWGCGSCRPRRTTAAGKGSRQRLGMDAKVVGSVWRHADTSKEEKWPSRIAVVNFFSGTWVPS